ncbi:MAG TPA: pentapeptide repeat-containing protein [Anaerolineae bacterium]
MNENLSPVAEPALSVAEVSPVAGPFSRSKHMNDDLTTDKITSRTELMEALNAGKDLRGVDLSGLQLTGLDMASADLSGANLSESILAGANLARTSLEGSRLDKAVIAGVNLEKGNLRGASLIGARIIATNLHEVDLTGANLSDSLMAATNVAGANFSGAATSGARAIAVAWSAVSVPPDELPESLSIPPWLPAIAGGLLFVILAIFIGRRWKRKHT